MSKEVKDYLSILGNRLGKAFSLERFGMEEELEFWALSAEHMSRKEAPSFQNIVEWVDLLYNAPVHVLYKKDGDNLILIKRQLLTKNLLHVENKKIDSASLESQRAQFIQDFENQIQNIEKKRQWSNEYNEHGISAHTIGNCEHIPLYKKDGEFWGVYVVGPFLKSPEQMKPKFSIISRLLSIWLIQLVDQENRSINRYQNKIEDLVGELGTGTLKTTAISNLFLLYIINAIGADAGAIVEYVDNKPNVIVQKNIDENILSAIDGSSEKPLFNLVNGEFLDTEIADKFAKKYKDRYFYVPYHEEDISGFILLYSDSKEIANNRDIVVDQLADTVSKLFDFRNKNLLLSETLMDTYFNMVRSIELKRDKTKYHTLRIIAFAEMFGMLFGLDANEANILKQTAKLHDIGYAGAVGLDSVATIGSELAHPLAGAIMISNLPIHDDVKNGVKTHHEWVNGKGSPEGLNGEDIPWTGKIISVFEFIVEFVESNIDAPKQDEERLLEQLKSDLIQRADEQFDMVLIPTVIQQITMLGWQGCVELGVPA